MRWLEFATWTNDDKRSWCFIAFPLGTQCVELARVAICLPACLAVWWFHTPQICQVSIYDFNGQPDWQHLHRAWWHCCRRKTNTLGMERLTQNNTKTRNSQASLIHRCREKMFYKSKIFCRISLIYIVYINNNKSDVKHDKIPSAA